MRLLIINLKLKSQIAKLSTFLLLAVQQQITIFTAIRETPKGHWPAKAELE
jgi:hypothetical protein